LYVTNRVCMGDEIILYEHYIHKLGTDNNVFILGRPISRRMYFG